MWAQFQDLFSVLRDRIRQDQGEIKQAHALLRTNHANYHISGGLISTATSTTTILTLKNGRAQWREEYRGAKR